MLERIMNGLAWTFIVATMFVLLRPGGLARTQIEDWRESRRQGQLAEELWPELSVASLRLGNAEVEPTVVEFMDYRCFYCRAFADTLSGFLVDHADLSVGIRFKILGADPVSKQAAEAAVCAEKQGRFPQMHSFLLADTVWYAEPDWERVAAKVGGLDESAFGRCIEAGVGQALVSRDSLLATRLMLRGTPTFVTARGQVRLGLVSSDELSDLTQRR